MRRSIWVVGFSMLMFASLLACVSQPQPKPPQRYKSRATAPAFKPKGQQVDVSNLRQGEDACETISFAETSASVTVCFSLDTSNGACFGGRSVLKFTFASPTLEDATPSNYAVEIEHPEGKSSWTPGDVKPEPQENNTFEARQDYQLRCGPPLDGAYGIKVARGSASNIKPFYVLNGATPSSAQQTGSVASPSTVNSAILIANLRLERAIYSGGAELADRKEQARTQRIKAPLSDLRSKEGACVEGWIDDRVSIKTCLQTGRPKTLEDDKKPRISTVIQAAQINRANPHNYQLRFIEAGQERFKERMLDQVANTGGRYSFVGGELRVVPIKAWSPGLYIFEYVYAYDTDQRLTLLIELVEDEN